MIVGNSAEMICLEAFYNSGTLTGIMYRGTEEQWNALPKKADWDLNTGDYTIIYNYTGE